MRRLGGLLWGLVVGGLLASMGALLAVSAPRDESAIPQIFAIAGIVCAVLAGSWIAYFEGTFPALNTKKVTRGLVSLAAGLALAGGAMWNLDGTSNRVFLVGSLALAAWGVLQLVDALRGPPRPEWVPADFTAVNRGILYSRALQGTVDSRKIVVEYSIAWNGEVITRSTVQGELPSGIAGIEIAAWGAVGAIVGTHQKTGDAAFDTAVRVRGRRDLVLALLTAPARAALAAVISSGGTISFLRGELRSNGRVPVEHLAHTANALRVGGSIADALRDNAGRDPNPEVRLACFQQLLGADTPDGRSAARVACRAAIADADPRIQVLGAAVLLLSNEAAERAQAERVLSTSSIGLGALVADLLDRADPASGGALVGVLDQRGGPDAIPAIERFAARSEVPEVLRALAQVAAAKIRERAAVERGRISLSADEPAAGALSVTDDAGRVALAPAPPRKPVAS